MKLLIASDIHGSALAVQKLAERVEAEAPDRIVLLGDLLYHGPRNPLPGGHDPKGAAETMNTWAEKVVAVRGNCDAEVDQMMLDFPCLADYALIETEGHILYLSHGHLYYANPDALPPLAPGDAFLSGHTHKKVLELREGIMLVNPGSAGLPKDGLASYAIYEKGCFTLKNLEGEKLESLSW